MKKLDAIYWITNLIGRYGKEYDEALEMAEFALRQIDEQPTAESEPHEGHWIGGSGSYICSECNSNPMDFIETMGSSFDAYVETPMNFCPSCGADMRGMEDG